MRETSDYTIIERLVFGSAITPNDVYRDLERYCRECSSMEGNEECPVFLRMSEDEEKALSVGFCSCFENGKKMAEFIRKNN